jgi:hypothetical protein
MVIEEQWPRNPAPGATGAEADVPPAIRTLRRAGPLRPPCTSQIGANGVHREVPNPQKWGSGEKRAVEEEN